MVSHPTFPHSPTSSLRGTYFFNTSTFAFALLLQTGRSQIFIKTPNRVDREKLALVSSIEAVWIFHSLRGETTKAIRQMFFEDHPNASLGLTARENLGGVIPALKTEWRELTEILQRFSQPFLCPQVLIIANRLQRCLGFYNGIS